MHFNMAAQPDSLGDMPVIQAHSMEEEKNLVPSTREGESKMSNAVGDMPLIGGCRRRRG